MPLFQAETVKEGRHMNQIRAAALRIHMFSVCWMAAKDMCQILEDEVVLQCSATVQKEQLKLCLSVEGFGNRLCFLEPTSNAQKVPPDLAICCFILEQSLSVRALQEMLANTVEVGVEGVDLDKWVGADFAAVIPPMPVPSPTPSAPLSLPCCAVCAPISSPGFPPRQISVGSEQLPGTRGDRAVAP
uniref:Uncharacterized protein n=1 Tax=Sphaerodactylus townsendi TaxID=933632 RepID=A0ACB8FTQ5_9SAUR